MWLRCQGRLAWGCNLVRVKTFAGVGYYRCRTGVSVLTKELGFDCGLEICPLILSYELLPMFLPFNLRRFPIWLPEPLRAPDLPLGNRSCRLLVWLRLSEMISLWNLNLYMGGLTYIWWMLQLSRRLPLSSSSVFVVDLMLDWNFIWFPWRSVRESVWATQTVLTPIDVLCEFLRRPVRLLIFVDSAFLTVLDGLNQ